MRRAGLVAAALTCIVASAAAELPLETIGRVETLKTPPDAHWLFVSDLLLQRSALLDLDRGEFLGMVSTGFLSPAGAFSRTRPEFYWPETFYSRGSRGSRTDVVTIYDTTTIGPVGEIEIPPKRAVNVLPSANFALSDDDRFLAVFNMTPATSLSIVDVVQRRFAGAIETPGCSLAYGAGPRRFLMLCADGGALVVGIDDAGREASKQRIAPFFDPEEDPVTEKAVRHGDEWIFVSFEGHAVPVDVSGPEVRIGERWSLVGEADREARWRIGGTQHLAVHPGLGRLYSLMHQGGPDTHKEAGSELWVYDLASRERITRLELSHPGLALLSESIEIGSTWPSPFDGLWGFVLDHLVPNPGLTGVQVTRDAEPLLVTGSQIGGSLAVYDARSLELLRRIPSGNMTTHVLQAPWDGRELAPR